MAKRGMLGMLVKGAAAATVVVVVVGASLVGAPGDSYAAQQREPFLSVADRELSESELAAIEADRQKALDAANEARKARRAAEARIKRSMEPVSPLVTDETELDGTQGWEEDETAAEGVTTDESDKFNGVKEATGNVADFKEDGRVTDGKNVFTYYSERVLPGDGLTELNSNGRHVGDDGLIRDGDGYIALATDGKEKGEIIETPWGAGKVYDCGCGDAVDVYVTW